MNPEDDPNWQEYPKAVTRDGVTFIVKSNDEETALRDAAEPVAQLIPDLPVDLDDSER